MIIQTTHLLENAKSVLFPHFFDLRVYNNIKLVIESLPHFTHLGLECRLGRSQSSEVGLFFCFNRHEWISNIFSSDLSRDQSMKTACFNKAWEIINKFFTVWNRVDDNPFIIMSNLYFEFDIKNEDHKDCIPCFFFNIDSYNGELQIHHRNAVIDGLKILSDNHFPKKNEQGLIECLKLLPPQGKLYACGKMLARGPDGIRYCFSNLDAGTIPRFLADLRWKGCVGLIETLLSKFDRFMESYIVHIDLDSEGQLSPNVGIEFFPTRGRAPVLSENWASVLETLAAEKLCCPLQKESLFSWPRLYSTEMISRILIYRRLSHLKLVFNGNNLIDVKVYLSIAQEWE